MARRSFGGTSADVIQDRAGNVRPNASFTVWTAESGGSQLTDLQTTAGVALPGGVGQSDANGRVGFLGPNDGTSTVWVDADSGKSGRYRLRASDAVPVLDNTGHLDVSVVPDLSRTYAPVAALAPRQNQQRRPQHTIVTTWQSGHGWTNVGTPSTWNLNDTSDHYAGSQCASVVTGGTGVQTFLRKMAMTAVDYTGKDIVVWVKVTNLTHLATINATFGSSSFANYHQWNLVDMTLFSSQVQQIREGEWFPLRCSYEIHGPVGTPSRTNVTDVQFGVKDDNTGNPVTVKFGGFGYYPKPSTFPNGVLSLSFDDTFASHYATVTPKLAQYGFGATFYTIADRATSAYVTTDQLREMQRFGHEIAAHAYTKANHDIGFQNLAAPDLDAELRNLKAWMLDNGFSPGADHLAYPQGWHSAATDPVMARYFRTGRLICDTPLEVQQPGLPLRMRARELTTGTVATVETLIDSAYTNGQWIHLVGHDIAAAGSGNVLSTSEFNTLVDYIASKGIPVLPVGQVWQAAA